jgi:hypothetical protein
LDHSFARAFAHGDLLVFAALVLLEVAADGDEVHRHAGAAFSAWFDVGLQAVKASAILIIFVFAAMRFSATQLLEAGNGHQSTSNAAAGSVDPATAGAETPNATTSAVPEKRAVTVDWKKLTAYSCFNTSIAVLAVMVSFAAAMRHLQYELDMEMQQHAGGGP